MGRKPTHAQNQLANPAQKLPSQDPRTCAMHSLNWEQICLNWFKRLSIILRVPNKMTTRTNSLSSKYVLWWAMFDLILLKRGPKMVKSDVNLNFTLHVYETVGKSGKWGFKEAEGRVWAGEWMRDTGTGTWKAPTFCLYTLFRREGISNSSVSSFKNNHCCLSAPESKKVRHLNSTAFVGSIVKSYG